MRCSDLDILTGISLSAYLSEASDSRRHPVKKMYAKTPKLRDARFRGRKALVVEALSICSTPVSLETLAPLVDRNGRYNALLNEWARENGGVKLSELYHLSALKRLGMVEEAFGTASIKTQIVGWGNRQALRIPKARPEELQIGEGDEEEMSVVNGRLTVRPLSQKLTLQVPGRSDHSGEPPPGD